MLFPLSNRPSSNLYFLIKFLLTSAHFFKANDKTCGSEMPGCHPAGYSHASWPGLGVEPWLAAYLEWCLNENTGWW